LGRDFRLAALSRWGKPKRDTLRALRRPLRSRLSEWECCLKHPEDGAREGAEFIKHHIIRVTDKAFDDFAGGAIDKKQINRALGLR